MPIFICAKATAELAVRGATFDKACSRCDCKVMMAPTSQALMEDHPEAVVLCLDCVSVQDLPDDAEIRLAGVSHGTEDKTGYPLQGE